MSFVDSINAATLPAAETSEDLPVFWFFNGDKRRQEPGVFYMKDGALWDDPTPPWQAGERFPGEKGWQAEVLRIALLGYRQQAFVSTSEDGRQSRRYLAEWEPGASFLNEILCIAEGLGDDPVVWSCKGLTGKAVLGKGGMLQQYNGGLLSVARKLARQAHGPEAARKIPLHAFWLPIASERDAQGRVIYTDTGHGSTVTLPALQLPAEITEQTIDACYVGPERLEHLAEIRADFEASGWFARRRGNVAETTEAVPSRPTTNETTDETAEMPF